MQPDRQTRFHDPPLSLKHGDITPTLIIGTGVNNSDKQKA